MCKLEHLRSLMSVITKMGVQLAVDNFGVGQSSLARLRNVRGAHVKLDGTFLRNDVDVESETKLLSSVINMIHEQKAKVTAEWVETEQQNTLLRHMGCDYAQGYFHSRPLSADQFGRIRDCTRQKHGANSSLDGFRARVGIA